MKTAKDYIADQAVLFEPFEARGVCDPIEIMPQLVGYHWDDLVLGILHAFKPTTLWVTEEGPPRISKPGRIIVYVNAAHIIQRITLEAVIGIPGYNDRDIAQHHHMMLEMAEGIASDIPHLNGVATFSPKPADD